MPAQKSAVVYVPGATIQGVGMIAARPDDGSDVSDLTVKAQNGCEGSRQETWVAFDNSKAHKSAQQSI